MSYNLPLPESTLRLVTDRTNESFLRLFFSITTGIITALGVTLLSLGAPPTSSILLILCGLACGSSVAAIGRIPLPTAASIGAVAVLLAITIRSLSSGGLSAPIVPWLAVPPFLAITLGGVTTARPTVATAIGCLIALFGAHYWTNASPWMNAGPMGMALQFRIALSFTTLIVLLSAVAWLTREAHRRSLSVMEESNEALHMEVIKHQQTRADLDTTYGEMLHIARRAGMGEVATGVLHNVGNALTGVNTSVALAVSAVDRSDDSLTKVADLLDEALSDEKRLKIATYLRRLHQTMHERRGRLRDELERIRNAAEHVGAIIQSQQQLATTGGVIEVVEAQELVSQSRLLLDASLKRHEITVHETTPPTLSVTVDRHRVVQILTNLVGNARDALRDSPGERVIRIISSRCENEVIFDIIDTGPGVPDGLSKTIFTHGFTTKSDGHGFGLHSSALAARDIGGYLTLEESTTGAHFRLRIPREPTAEPTGPRPKNRVYTPAITRLKRDLTRDLTRERTTGMIRR